MCAMVVIPTETVTNQRMAMGNTPTMERMFYRRHRQRTMQQGSNNQLPTLASVIILPSLSRKKIFFLLFLFCFLLS